MFPTVTLALGEFGKRAFAASGAGDAGHVDEEFVPNQKLDDVLVVRFQKVGEGTLPLGLIFTKTTWTYQSVLGGVGHILPRRGFHHGWLFHHLPGFPFFFWEQMMN